MAEYRSNSDYDFSRFRSKDSALRYDSYSSAAVKLPPEEPYYENEGHGAGSGQRKQKTKSDRKAARAAQFNIIKVLTITVVFVIMFAAVLKCRIASDSMLANIAAAEARLKTANSENTRLTMAIMSDSSYDKIEELAKNKLGMVKLDGSQITYFETTNGDKVIVKKNK